MTNSIRRALSVAAAIVLSEGRTVMAITSETHTDEDIPDELFVIGICRACEKPIYAVDEYEAGLINDWDVMWHHRCYPAIRVQG